MFSEEFLNIREQMLEFAKENRHQFLTVELLLLYLLSDKKVDQVLQICHADTSKIRECLLDYLNDYVPKRDKDIIVESKSLKRVIQRAIWQVQASQENGLVQPTDLLVAIFKEDECFANQVMQNNGLDILNVTKTISNLVRQDWVQMALSADGNEIGERQNPIEIYTQNLNQLAKDGKCDPLIGRVQEIERVAQILCRRRKNNPLLVGDAGVGKTAIAEGLAWLIVNAQAPKALLNATVYSLNVAALIAGTKFRGDFEDRVKDLLSALKSQQDAILFIDEIHMIIGAGTSSESMMDISNLLKPALAKGELRCIGSTTFVEFRQIFEKDHALSRRFQKIDVLEPSLSDATEILFGLKKYYEDFHQVRYTNAAIESAVKLSNKYIHERFLPDKAIDVIDEAGAFVRLNNQENQEIDVPLIEQVVAKIARIAPKSISSDDKEILKNLSANLKKMVFGQDAAVDVLCDAICLARAGLANPEKPIGSLLFTGPTGVGKTEISKQLAFMLGVPFLRFDMSEYMESHTASRLIGAPPGYVGFDQGGLLTEKIQQNPHCVLLLDEIEKAHSDVFNLLLQVMDHGTLTDNNGRSVSFKQVILIMTSNVGAENIARRSMGFTEQDHQHDNEDAIKRTFSPEFRNRLDAVINFAPLSSDVMADVVEKFISELQSALAEKDVVLKINQNAKQYLAKLGYDRLMGARPLARVIQKELKKPLAQMILFGELSDGGVVTVNLKDERLEFLVEV